MTKGSERFESTREIIQHIAEHCSETTKVVVCDETGKDTSVQTAQPVARSEAAFQKQLTQVFVLEKGIADFLENHPEMSTIQESVRMDLNINSARSLTPHHFRTRSTPSPTSGSKTCFHFHLTDCV